MNVVGGDMDEYRPDVFLENVIALSSSFPLLFLSFVFLCLLRLFFFFLLLLRLGFVDVHRNPNRLPGGIVIIFSAGFLNVGLSLAAARWEVDGGCIKCASSSNGGLPGLETTLEHQRSTMANTLTLTEHLAIKTYHRQQQLQQQQHHRARKQTPALQQTSPLCEQRSLDSAVDIIILLLVLGACGFLFTPYFTYVCGEVAEVLPATYLMIWEVVYQAPVAYAGAAVTMFVAVISVYEIYQYKARRCENPKCRGLRKAMELDIQLETEQCVKSSALMAEKMPRNGSFDLGQDQKELEAELRRMAPPNGRAVLIFRAPCGCPAAHFEAWGSKKALRRSKR